MLQNGFIIPQRFKLNSIKREKVLIMFHVCCNNEKIRVKPGDSRNRALSLWSDIPNPIISSLWTLESNPPENSEILGSSRMESQAS